MYYRYYETSLMEDVVFNMCHLRVLFNADYVELEVED